MRRGRYHKSTTALIGLRRLTPTHNEGVHRRKRTNRAQRTRFRAHSPVHNKPPDKEGPPLQEAQDAPRGWEHDF